MLEMMTWEDKSQIGTCKQVTTQVYERHIVIYYLKLIIYIVQILI